MHVKQGGLVTLFATDIRYTQLSLTPMTHYPANMATEGRRFFNVVLPPMPLGCRLGGPQSCRLWPGPICEH